MGNAQVAELIGEEDASRIGVLDIQKFTRTISAMVRDGVVVTIHIRRWRSESKLTLRDMGIVPETPEEEKAWRGMLNLGNKLLLPRSVVEQFDSFDNRSRAWLRAESLNTDWGRFIPRGNYRKWVEQTKLYRESYYKLGQETAENWDALVAEVIAEYRVIAANNYLRLRKAGVKGLGTEEEFVEQFIENIRKQIPTAEAFLKKLYFDWRATYLPLNEKVEVIAGDVRDEMEADLKREAARKAANDLNTFVVNVVGDVRSKVYDAVVDVLEAIQEGGDKMPRNSTAQLGRLVAKIKDLKFWPDDELEGQLESIAKLCETPSNKRDVKAVKSALTKLGAESRLALIELDMTPSRSGSEVGIPDDFDDGLAEVAKGRRRKAEPEVDVSALENPVVDFEVNTNGRGGTEEVDVSAL